MSSNTRRVVKVLRQLGQETLWWHEPLDKYEGKSLDQPLEEPPDLLNVLDVLNILVLCPNGGVAVSAFFRTRRSVSKRGKSGSGPFYVNLIPIEYKIHIKWAKTLRIFRLTEGQCLQSRSDLSTNKPASASH